MVYVTCEQCSSTPDFLKLINCYISFMLLLHDLHLIFTTAFNLLLEFQRKELVSFLIEEVHRVVMAGFPLVWSQKFRFVNIQFRSIPVNQLDNGLWTALLTEGKVNEWGMLLCFYLEIFSPYLLYGLFHQDYPKKWVQKNYSLLNFTRCVKKYPKFSTFLETHPERSKPSPIECYY